MVVELEITRHLSCVVIEQLHASCQFHSSPSDLNLVNSSCYWWCINSRSKIWMIEARILISRSTLDYWKTDVLRLWNLLRWFSSLFKWWLAWRCKFTNFERKLLIFGFDLLRSLNLAPYLVFIQKCFLSDPNIFNTEVICSFWLFIWRHAKSAGV